MNKILTVFAFLLWAVASDAQIGKWIDKAKADVKVMKGEDNTALGLKEALNNGVEAAVSQLSIQDGFFGSPYKILIPADAQKVINVVKKVPGFEDTETKLIAKMNQAAEIAVKKATPIFVDAIKGMSIKDASAILFGNKDAATRYLESSSRKALYDAFLPVIQSSLDEVNARTYWRSVVDAYNKIPFQKKLNPELDDHVNNKSLDGLFSLIQEKEEGIRSDVSQRTSPLLQEVFGKLK
ncbi:MAG: DUF4197 domain-containing protein [Saprospiraceae bacterium]|nr:DUF4197 domain-containing protein [Saprospiraceae bacterium]